MKRPLVESRPSILGMQERVQLHLVGVGDVAAITPRATRGAIGACTYCVVSVGVTPEKSLDYSRFSPLMSARRWRTSRRVPGRMCDGGGGGLRSFSNSEGSEYRRYAVLVLRCPFANAPQAINIGP